VRDHADAFARRSGLRVDLELPPDLVRLPRETELALFRVLQEALANVQHHSGSKTASICVTQTAGEIRLEVRDHGRGMAPERGLPIRLERLKSTQAPEGSSDAQSGLAIRPLEAASKGTVRGLGIPGMKERMRQLGGRLELRSNENGTMVLAILPRPREIPRV
jgi:signal transduction histidine kinase